eukprot:1140327-Pelagomonas_calceolata.AAC.4
MTGLCLDERANPPAVLSKLLVNRGVSLHAFKEVVCPVILMLHTPGQRKQCLCMPCRDALFLVVMLHMLDPYASHSWSTETVSLRAL